MIIILVGRRSDAEHQQQQDHPQDHQQDHQQDLA
jgi:hypothetical protein